MYEDGASLRADEITSAYDPRMKIVNERPPEWIMTGCLSQFRVNVNNTFWAYGDVIYNPGGITIREDILAHEAQHGVQQSNTEGGPDAWWKRYLAEPRFRLEQEADAYGVQYRWFCARYKDRNQRNKFLVMIAGQLSGPLYQVAVSPLQARQMIEVLAGQRMLPKAPHGVPVAVL